MTNGGGTAENLNIIRVRAERKIGPSELVRAISEYIVSDDARLDDCAQYCADVYDHNRRGDQGYLEELADKAKAHLNEELEGAMVFEHVIAAIGITALVMFVLGFVVATATKSLGMA